MDSITFYMMSEVRIINKDLRVGQLVAYSAQNYYFNQKIIPR